MDGSSDETHNWLIDHLIKSFRIAAIACISAIFIRRLYLAGVLGSLTSSSLLERLLPWLGVLDEALDLTVLLGTPVAWWLWFRFFRLGYLEKPRMHDYFLAIGLYVVAVGYLAPPNGHGAMHFGR